MAFDLVIKNGVVIDGSGLPRYRADVAVNDGRIASIGRIRERAREVVDAEGRVVAPGFVDGHTHMDAQIFWDPLGTCSCWHGITTVVMGNCGFTLAPCADKDKQLVMRNLERAEDISADAMNVGIEWSWTTFREYLDTRGATYRTVPRDEMIRETARRLEEDQAVVGWFQGRMEWGPRALGNRSIVCDPRRADMKDILNLKIKRCE